jgi:hypothetical protein
LESDSMKTENPIEEEKKELLSPITKKFKPPIT